MTPDVDPPAPFEPSVVAAVADDRTVSADDLVASLGAHQASVRELPGVEELVYEWRKHYDGAVVERTPAAYYCSVPATVWDEFSAALDVEGERRAAMEAVHAETVRRRPDAPDDPADGDAFVVLDRTGEA